MILPASVQIHSPMPNSVRFSLFLLVMGLPLAWGSNSEVSVSSRLVPPSTSFRLGKVFDLEVDLSYPAGGEPLIVEQNPLLHLPEQLELVGTGSGRRTENGGGSVTNKFFFRYSVKGVKHG